MNDELKERDDFEHFLRAKKFPVLPVWQNGKPHQNYALEVMWDSWIARAALQAAPAQMSEATRKLAEQVLAERDSDTRTDEQIARDGADFICDTRLDTPTAADAPGMAEPVAYVYEHATYPDDHARIVSFARKSHSDGFVCRPLVYEGEPQSSPTAVVLDDAQKYAIKMFDKWAADKNLPLYSALLALAASPAAPAQSAQPVRAKTIDSLLADIDALLCDRMKADPHGTLDKALEKARNVRALLSAPQPSPTAVVLDERAHEWAPARVWLQREQGEGGSHTWCEDSVGDGDLIEEAEYVRVGAPSVEQTRALTEKEIIDVLPVDCSKVYGDFERGYNKALSHAREKIHAALTAARPASGETE